MNYSKAEKDFFKAYSNWLNKIDFIENQIAALNNLSDVPIIFMLTFLLKTQLVEFRLKRLISSMDYHLAFSNVSRLIRRKSRTPKDFDEAKMTLGQLKNELNEFNGEMLVNIQRDLSVLNQKRILFAHKIFNSETGFDQLNKEARIGNNIADKVINEIKIIDKLMKDF